MDNELYHYGILGMKWGVRRTPEQLGHKSSTGKKKSSGLFGKSKSKSSSKTTSSKSSKPKYKKRAISDLSDDELRTRINRLQLEKNYRDLVQSSKKVSRGKKVLGDIFESSAKNIGTQLVTNAMGSAVNKIFKEEIVNPKKGQKDK